MASQSHEPKLSARTPISVAMATVIAAFLATLWISYSRSESIDAEVGTLVHNAAPSMADLSKVRTDLRRLHLAVGEHLTDAHAETNIQKLRDDIARELAAFESMPGFTDKPQFVAAIDDARPAVDAALNRTLTSLHANRADRAHQMLHDELHPALDRLDDAVGDAQLRITELVEHRAYEIAAARRDSRDLAVLLGGLSVVAAVAAGSFAFLALRRQGRVIAEHARLLSERANELEAFAGRVAHDLRNPLSGVMLRVETLRARGYTDPALTAALDKLEAQAQRMDNVIEGLLGFAVAGARPTTDASTDVREVIDGVVADLRPAAELAEARIITEPLPRVAVACSSGALTSAVSNLVSNAVKYIADSTASQRRIAIRVAPQGERVHIEVEDNGPGLPPGTEQEVFAPFRRVTPSRQPGLGIGLATVKRLVEAHGGQVGVINNPGHGATFWIELPRSA